MNATEYRGRNDVERELASELHRRRQMATDPSVSEAQRRAMQAAAHGHSTLGISKSVGEEFVGKDASHQGKSGRVYTTEELRRDYRTVHVGAAGSKGYWHPDVGHFTIDGQPGMDAKLEVGAFVIIPFATLHGLKKQRARVTRILPDGRIEVKGVTDGGYYVFSPYEIGGDDQPGMITSPSASTPTGRWGGRPSTKAGGRDAASAEEHGAAAARKGITGGYASPKDARQNITKGMPHGMTWPGGSKGG